MRSGSRLLPGKDSEAGNGLELNWEDLWDLGLEPYWPGAPASRGGDSLKTAATLQNVGLNVHLIANYPVTLRRMEGFLTKRD